MADDSSEVAKREEEILKFWKENGVFEKSLKKSAPKGEFVFYDGPPFATGTPHQGSLLSSVSKDVIPRYKTMRGYFVRRRWGWDTHGLPIESLVEKKLGLKNKKEILALGIEKFNETARSMVLEYVHEWKRYVERVGRWVDFDNSYKTMDATFTESVWWALKKIHEKGHLYEGRKVLMYCTHDETVLAKAEIAMDETYKDITEEAVTAKFELADHPGTYFLAWTTTPWTLPGNVALAVGSDIEYVKVKTDDGTYILAKERLDAVFKGKQYEVLGTMKGKEFAGGSYKPLFAVPKIAGAQKKYTVVTADFVKTDEGTGIVHTAVMYGEDDFNLGKAEGLPMVQLLNGNGTYNDDAPEFVRGQYIKKAEALIKTDLESRGLLFSKEAHTHRYPHCYRCGTPLIYNAVSSWFIDIQAVKNKLISENEKITWFPEHLKHGRFLKILEGAPDWTISRNRFWASPLPIWKDKDGNVTVIGSLDELKKHTKTSGNRYFVMRHGEAEHNTAAVHTDALHINSHLTEKGKREVAAHAERFQEKPDVIIASPYTRAKETAELVSAAVGYPAKDVVYDERLKEWHISSFFEGKPRSEMKQFYDVDYMKTPDSAPGGGESFKDVTARVGGFLYELEEKYAGKKILLITHAGTARALTFLSAGLAFSRMPGMAPLAVPEVASITEVPFVPLPHNAEYELDYHLPYIDRVQLINEKGEALTRIPEVVDCWVESGAMPFAEYHYPFENENEFKKRAPGDFVSEYIGQTRAWFYYMHVMSVELFGRQSFRHVITTGNVNAKDGQKLSKSKKNFTDPYTLFDQYGADAFRYYMMSSVVMQAEDMQFKDEEVKEAHAKVVNLLRNTYAFYSLYKDEAGAASDTSPHVLDKWILARLSGLISEVTEALDRYDVPRATRPMREFIDDFSTWYVRRSRDRVKGEDAADKAYALSTMRFILKQLSKVVAPVMPFIAEEIWRGVREETDVESVHLTTWPEAKKGFLGLFAPQNGSLLSDMAEVRRVVSLALERRSAANIKVRQPLAELKIKSAQLSGKAELLALVSAELNVKNVSVDATLSEDVLLDTNISPELKEEGVVREVLRFVQDLRKQASFMPHDKAVLLAGDDASKAFAEKHWPSFRTANLERVEAGASGKEIVVEGVSYHFDVRRA